MMMNFEELVNRSGVDFGEMDSRFFYGSFVYEGDRRC